MPSQCRPAEAFRHRIRSFISDRRGNFGIMTALLLPCIAGAAGLAIDLSSALLARNQMAGAADAGALAAAAGLADKKLTDSSAKETAHHFVISQAAALGLKPSDYKVDVDVATTSMSNARKKFDVSVSVSASIPTTLMQVVGRSSVPVAVNAVAQSATANQTSLSMYLVLDRSGSMKASVTTSVKSLTSPCDFHYMNLFQTALYTVRNSRPCYYQRIEVLQAAVADLMGSLAKADPDRKYIRTGAVAYSSGMFDPSALDWGTDKTGNYVADMFAEGGTSSTDAFEEALDALTKQSENAAHLGKNGLTPSKYIVFMTDGENSNSSDNSRTQSLCTRAKSAGITVYTVGFMLSTVASKNLMNNCASSVRTYFDAQDGSRLAAAFADIARQTAGASPLVTH